MNDLKLNPGYFAFVMATGIVSIAARHLGMDLIARVLFLINKIAYVVFVVLTVRLVLIAPRAVWKGIAGYEKGPAFFTVVAGTCVLGAQFADFGENRTVAFALLITGFGLWLILIYSFFTSIIVIGSKPRLEDTLHGGWLIFVVGTHAVSILGTTLAPFDGEYRSIFLFLMLSLYFIGVMLYLILSVLIMYRLIFFTLSPETFTPLYWITMGAGAITTLSGATIMMAGEKVPFYGASLPIVEGLTFLFWSFTTWWIPLLIALNVWRYFLKRISLAYDVQYWSMVFPLGMYTFCTQQFANAAGLPFLLHVSRLFIYLALLAWLVTSLGLFKELIGLFYRSWKV